MQFTIETKTLKIACELLRAVKVKDTANVLHNVLILLKKDLVILYRTDWELSVKVAIDTKILGKLSQEKLLIDFHKLDTLSRTKLFSQVTFEVKKDKLFVTGIDKVLQRVKRFDLEDVENFPEPAESENKLKYKVPIGFNKIVRQALKWASSEQAHRYPINGVYFKVAKEFVAIAATNGKCLFYQKANTVKDFSNFSIKKSGKDAGPSEELRASMEKLGVICKFLLDDTIISKETGGVVFNVPGLKTEFRVRELEGRFPNPLEFISKDTKENWLELLFAKNKKMVTGITELGVDKDYCELPGYCLTKEKDILKIKSNSAEDSFSFPCKGVIKKPLHIQRCFFLNALLDMPEKVSWFTQNKNSLSARFVYSSGAVLVVMPLTGE